MNDRHVKEVRRVWAFCFDAAYDPEIKHLVLGNYIKDLHFHDPVSAEELSIFIYLQVPRAKTFGDQTTIPYEQTQTRI